MIVFGTEGKGLMCVIALLLTPILFGITISLLENLVTPVLVGLFAFVPVAILGAIVWRGFARDNKRFPGEHKLYFLPAHLWAIPIWLFGLVFAVGYTVEALQPVEQTHVTVTVVRANQTPVEGAEVWLLKDKLIRHGLGASYSDGSVEIPIERIRPGTFQAIEATWEDDQGHKYYGKSPETGADFPMTIEIKEE